jgi:hypothetical protein
MSDVQQLLEELARDTEPRGAEEVFGGATRRAAGLRRTRRARRVGVSFGAIAAIVVVIALVAQSSTTTHPRVDVREPATTTGTATAAQLAAGHWSTIPAAPIEPRIAASVVWTGKELIVWGGERRDNTNVVYDDGAAYNPTTRAWRRLPASPLSGRASAVAVWTGDEVVIWGGYHPGVAEHAEGAAYEPATNRWRLIVSGPALPNAYAVGLWTGDRVVILGGTEAFSYDPLADQWSTLPPIPAHEGPPGFDVTPSSVNTATTDGAGHVYAFAIWEAVKHITAEESQGTGGADLLRYDESTNAWTIAHPHPAAIPEPEESFWAGGRLLVRGDIHTPGAEGPGPLPETSAWIDPETGGASVLPPDAMNGDHGFGGHFSSAFTGDALWSWNAMGEAGPLRPGDASAYDVATNSWRRLPSAPTGCAEPAAPVWTGSTVIVWCPQPFPARVGSIAGFEYVPG